jgi:hypothetical protein
MQKNLLLFLLSLLLAAGLMPTPLPDDNGDASWARQVLPELLGRKARGWEESDVLSQAIELMGREKVSRAIMSRPEFVDHWTDIVMDHIQVQRKGYSGNRNAVYACWSEPLLSSHDEKLARWVESHNPDGAVSQIYQLLVDSQGLPIPLIDAGFLGELPPPDNPWNMNDLIRSSLLSDNLGPIYLANLIPFEMNPGYNSETRELGRARLGNKFDEIYLGRNQSCMDCHTESYSQSDTWENTLGVGPRWIRTYPQYPAAESQVFQGTTAESHAPFNPHFRGGEFKDPWGIDISCVSGEKGNEPELVEGLSVDLPNTYFGEEPGDDLAMASLASVKGKDKSILDVEQALRAGIHSLSGRSLNSHESDDEQTELNPEEALAYLLAININNNIWQQLMGERLTIAHGYSRNEAQRDILRFLTEESFLPGRWSLRNVLESIVTSPWFNRTAPYAADTDTFNSPYHLPMVLDPWLALPPWSAADPSPENEANSQGRVVHRYAPRTLMRSAVAALGHDDLPTHLPEISIPQYKFAKNLGQYLNDYLPGTRSTDFVGMMTWFNEYGSCQKPPGQGADWVDHLSVQALAWDEENPTLPPLQLRDVVLALKDRLIGEPTLNADVPDGMPGDFESQSIEGLFDGYPLETPVSFIGAATLEDGARSYCGALVSSPQFMLAGIRPAEEGESPRLRVCSPDEPCGWRETCQDWLPALEQISGFDLQCDGEKLGHKIEFSLDRRQHVDVPRQQATDSGPRLGAPIPLDTQRFRPPPPPPPSFKLPPEPDPSPEDRRLPSSMPMR